MAPGIHEGEEAVAAAEVVAATVDQSAAELPTAVKTWIKDNPSALSADTVPLALQALDRVSGKDSELHELWVEDADDPEWAASINDLKRRLEQARS